MRRIIVAICVAVAFGGCGSRAAAAQDSARALQPLLTEAHDAQTRGDFEAAAASYRKATELDPSVPELWANLGLMCHQLGQSPEAIHSFKRALQLNPSLFVPELFLGIDYLRVQNPRAAVPLLEDAAKQHPDDIEVTLSLGAAYAMLNNRDRALQSYWRATELAPQNARAWLGLGNAYLQQVEENARIMTSTYGHSPYVKLRAAEILTEEGKRSQAENAYRAAIASLPVVPCAHAEYGIALLDEKRITEAREQFRLEMGTPSGCSLTQLGLSIANAADGHSELALQSLISSAISDPAFVRLNLPLLRDALSASQITNLIRAGQAKGSPGTEIVSLLERALQSDGTTAVDKFRSGEHLSANEERPSITAEEAYAQGKYRVCDKDLTSGLSTIGVVRQRILASCSFYSGDFQTTALVASRLKANPLTRVEGLYWEGKSDEKLAVSALGRASEIDPNSPRMYVLLGDVYRQKRHWGDAETEYRKAVALDPGSRAARLSLAIVLFTELKTTEAFEIDKSLLRESPNDPEGNLLAGEILAQQHHFPEAESYLSKCRNLVPELVPRLHVLLGQVYAATGRIQEAISEDKLGSARDDDGSIHYQLARLYLKVGDRVAADRQFQISKQLRERWDNQAHIDLGQLTANTDQP